MENVSFDFHLTKLSGTGSQGMAAQSKCAGGWPFGHLQRNICCLLHTCQTCIQDKVASEAYHYSTIAILPTTQKHIYWAGMGLRR